MSYPHIQSEQSRRHAIQFLAVLIAAVAYNRTAAVVREKGYEELLYAMLRGEISIHGSTGITRVQGARGTYSSGTSFTAVFISTPTNGNIIILAFGNRANPTVTVSSISQTGVTWNASKSIGLSNSSGNVDIEIWLGQVNAGASKTITINLSGSNAVDAIADAYEYSNLSSTLDKTASQYTGSSTHPNTGTTATTTQANELFVGATWNSASGGLSAAQSAATNSFALLDGADDGANHGSLAFLEKIVSSTGTANCSTTCNSGTGIGCIATFVATSTSVPINVSDTGSGVEVMTSSFTFGVSDSGSGADSPTENMNFLDAAIGGETPIVPWLKISDSGVGSDAEASTVSFSVGDSGSGVDNPIEWLYYNDQSNRINVPGSPQCYDFGSGMEAIDLQVSFGVADVGSGVEVATFTATFEADDFGFGSEAFVVESTAKDVGSGSEATILEADFTVGDVGSGAEISTEGPSAADSGSGLETPTSQATFGVNDSGTGSELPLLQVTFTVNDAAVGSETFLQGLAVNIGDAGSGSETFGNFASWSLSDVGSGSDSMASTATFSVFDVVVGVDLLILDKNFTVYDLAQGGDRFAIRVLKSGRLQYTVRLSVTENAFDPAAFDPYAYE
jgi:hypothetical protein